MTNNIAASVFPNQPVKNRFVVVGVPNTGLFETLLWRVRV